MRIIKLGVILSCVFLFTMSIPKKKNLNVVFISGSNEYVSHITLKEYKRELEATYANVKVTILQANGPLNEKNEYSNS